MTETPPTQQIDPAAINSMSDKLTAALNEIRNPTQSQAAPTAPAVPAVTAAPVVPAAPAEPKPTVPKFDKLKPAEQVHQAQPDEPLPEAIQQATPKARDSFRTIVNEKRRIEQEYKQKLHELQVKLEQSAKTPTVPTDYEETKKQAARAKELEDQLKRLDVSRDERFVSTFDTPISEAREALKGLGTPETADAVEAILETAPGKYRDQLARNTAKQLDDVEKFQFMQEYDRMNKLQRSRKAELEKAPEVYQKLQATREQEMAVEQANRAKAQQSLVESVMTEAVSSVPYLADRPGDQEWNSRAAESRDRVKTFLSGNLTPQEVGQVAVWAEYGIRAAEEMAVKDALVLKLTEQLKGIQASGPSVTGTPGGGNTGHVYSPSGDVLKDAAEMGRKFEAAMGR